VPASSAAASAAASSAGVGADSGTVCAATGDAASARKIAVPAQNVDEEVRMMLPFKLKFTVACLPFAGDAMRSIRSQQEMSSFSDCKITLGALFTSR
jgi:hypothetical protein